MLGVPHSASPEDVADAYRRLAKSWHPDRGGGAPAALRMAEINAAYDQLRGRLARRAAHGERRAPARARPNGWWVPARLRRALGAELLAVLQRDEEVVLVAPAATWASPRTRLALTDRRLLWLHEDAISHRVRWLALDSIEEAAERLAWPRRRTAVLRVRATGGRRLTFAELRPQVARAIVDRIAGRPQAAGVDGGAAAPSARSPSTPR